MQCTLARTVRRLDEHMGRLQRSLYNIKRKKKLYKENRLSISPPSEENKMTISPAIRWRTFKLSAISASVQLTFAY